MKTKFDKNRYKPEFATLNLQAKEIWGTVTVFLGTLMLLELVVTVLGWL